MLFMLHIEAIYVADGWDRGHVIHVAEHEIYVAEPPDICCRTMWYMLQSHVIYVAEPCDIWCKALLYMVQSHAIYVAEPCEIFGRAM
jgi:hypothetical protein